MKQWFSSYTVLSVLLSLATIFVVYESRAAGNDPATGDVATHSTGLPASIGLTDAQKTQVKDIISQYQPTLKPLVSQYSAERQQLRKLMHSSPVDDGAIRAQAEKVASLGADLAVRRAHLIQDIRGLLTPEQIQILAQKDDDALSARIDRFLFRLAGLGKRG